jgi:hypothetical protein
MYSKVAVELLVLFTISGAVLSASVAKKASDVDQMGKEFSVLQKVFDDCQENDDFGGCLKGKALTAISRAVDQVSFEFSVIKVNKNR